MSNLTVLFEGKKPTEIKEASDKVVKLIKEKKIASSDLSIGDIAEATLGRAGMRSLRESNEDTCFHALREAADPASLRAFTNITGQLIFTETYEGYQSADFIGEQLVTMETSRSDNTRAIGLGPINDDTLVVPEGAEYPNTKFGEDWVDVPQSQKRGMKIALTREAVFFDQTGDLLTQARGIGERLGVNREKRILRTVLGIDNTFKRKGIARNTYVASADPRINRKSGFELIDWTDIDEALQIFADMRDDRTTPEPIVVNPKQMIVSRAKLMTAMRILNGTEIVTKTDSANTETKWANPVAGMLNVLSSPWVDSVLVDSGVSAANAKNYWHMGDFKKAFRYRTLFPMQVRAAAPNDVDEFDRDIVAKFRCDERGVPYVWAPWYAAQFYVA